MKYYSELTNKLYDTPELAKEAEEAAKAEKEKVSKLKEMRAVRAKEVMNAYDNYLKLKEAFLKDYGSFHMTTYYNNEKGAATPVSEFIESFINLI